MQSALLIVDVQNDFTEGGALAVEGGAMVAKRATRLLREHPGEYSLVIASRDWHHPTGDNGGHFATDSEPDFRATWPRHCVADTPGAAYHPDLDDFLIDVHIRKGQGMPAYSAFDGVTDTGLTLAELLHEHRIVRVDVVGIATDYCVRASALDAVGNGQRVRALTDVIAGVAPHTSQAALAELRSAGAELVTSDHV